jgi:RNA polymerase sigma factor (sigma-70 family)
MSQQQCLKRRSGSFSAEQAIDRYRQGSASALGELMREYSPAMASVARRYLVDAYDVEDAVQDAWVSFVKAEHTIVHPERAVGWLCVTAGRAALTIAMRAMRCTPAAETLLEVTRELIWIDDQDGIDELARRRVVREALAHLNERDRELIQLLVSDDDLSYAAISKLTGCAIGSIGPTRQRIIAKLGRHPSIRQLAMERSA